jgi:pilus assembly protein CpaE
MLRAIIIGGDRDLKEKLETGFNAIGRFALMRWVARLPEGNELARILRAHAPQVVYVGVENLDKTLEMAREIEATIPGLPVVAFGRDLSSTVLLALMKAGIREFVPLPLQHSMLVTLADRLDDHLTKNQLSFDSTDLLFSFLPAKPGVGTSTLALNLSVAFAKQPNTNVLLADFDLNSGLIAFMLKMAGAYSVVDAAEMAHQLDESLWPQLLQELGNLHILPAGRPTPGVRIQPAQIEQLFTFARRLYTVICVDLSGNMEKYSIELMHESKRIFVVTTPEIPPLHLARERINFLRQVDLVDRVSILLNRTHKQSSITVAQIEDVLEAPVYETFPNSYHVVHQSLVQARPVDPHSDLGSRFYAVARRILSPEAPDKRPRKKGLLERFAIMPGKGTVRV